MKLIVVSSDDVFEQESQLVNQLFDTGLACYHLRKPQLPIDSQRLFIKSIEEKYHNRIVLHDNFELTEELNLKGIHLNRRNQTPPLNIKGLTVSKSCHSLEELQDISSFDYVFLSPIFDSISKTGYKKGFTEEELLAAKENKLITEKVIALGGISKNNIALIEKFGFGGAALLGSIWKEGENAIRKFSSFITHHS